MHHDERVRELVSTRLVQTNEVRRCALLLPAFVTIAARAGGQSLALVEVGASAGLNLPWGRYAYDYGDGHLRGDPASPVRLDCALAGASRPPLPDSLPRVTWRVGFDLQPIDVWDPGAVLCVCHTFTVNQFSADARERLAELLAGAATGRPVHRVSVEWFGGDCARLELAVYQGGSATAEVLARCHPDGRWLEWAGAAAGC